jgi:two-component system nitrate/nitrite response regulator NarL
MLTVSEDADDLLHTLRGGATGYLLKNIEADTLVNAIRMAAAGESVISPLMMGKLLGGAAASKPAASAPPAAADGDSEKLSPREREILAFVARGQSNKEIARALDLAESTVKIHVQSILRKLNLTSRVQAAVYAVGHGFAEEAQKRQ